jgi:hypothetical protein
MPALGRRRRGRRGRRPLWAQRAPKATAVEVWKDASCGCCHDWIAHMEQNGFAVTRTTAATTPCAPGWGWRRNTACHTALVGGYVIEGHVRRRACALLRERPDALGLAVPGMPVGSPGMDGAVYGGRRDRYDTVLVLRDGTSRVYQKHG